MIYLDKQDDWPNIRLDVLNTEIDNPGVAEQLHFVLGRDLR